MIDYGGFQPPRPVAGSPPPRGAAPYRGAIVFADSGTVMSSSFRLPLLVCAERGYLLVAWSPYVAAEVARVATREWVKSALKEAIAQGTADVGKAATQAMETVREGIDTAIAALERNWLCPAPDALKVASQQASPLSDDKDWPVLAAAAAVGARYLLSLDQESFPHGSSWKNIAFWHPDTFLTAFFQIDREAYIDVRLDLADIEQPVRLFPASAGSQRSEGAQEDAAKRVRPERA